MHCLVFSFSKRWGAGRKSFMKAMAWLLLLLLLISFCPRPTKSMIALTVAFSWKNVRLIVQLTTLWISSGAIYTGPSNMYTCTIIFTNNLITMVGSLVHHLQWSTKPILCKSYTYFINNPHCFHRVKGLKVTTESKIWLFHWRSRQVDL